jgi:hypothetical protein
MSTDDTLDSMATRNRLMPPAAPSTGPWFPAYRQVPGPEVGKDPGITSGGLTAALGLGGSTATGAEALGSSVAVSSDAGMSGGLAQVELVPDVPDAIRTPMKASAPSRTKLASATTGARSRGRGRG